MEKFLTGAQDFITGIIFEKIPHIIVALIILWIGLKLIKLLDKWLKKKLNNREIDISLHNFILSIINIILKILLFLSVMGMIGIQVTSFIAILGAAGLAVGMALQGTLQNFAGGVIILILKPYKIGDFIEQGSFSGEVKSIQIFNTILCTPDNKTIIIPNTQLATNTLINYTKSEIRRVDVNVGVAYGESIDNARNTILEIVNQYPLTLQEPEVPMVHVLNLSDSSVDLQVRVWVKTNNYWAALFYINQAIYDKFNERNIKIPFNQLEVHVAKE